MNMASQSLIDIAHKYFTALIKRDAEYLMAHSIDEPVNSYSGINSVPGGVHSLANTLDHVRSLPPAEFVDLKLSGYEKDEFAWFAGEGFGVIPSGERLGVRLTLILCFTEQEWKAAHYHVSEGIARYV